MRRGADVCDAERHWLVLTRARPVKIERAASCDDVIIDMRKRELFVKSSVENNRNIVMYHGENKAGK